jgi:hypothetical protein
MAHRFAWLIENKVFIQYLEGQVTSEDITRPAGFYTAAIRGLPHKTHLIVDLTQLERLHLGLSHAKQLIFSPVLPQQGLIVFIMQPGQPYYGPTQFLAITIMKLVNLPFHFVPSLPAALQILSQHDESITPDLFTDK